MLSSFTQKKHPQVSKTVYLGINKMKFVEDSPNALAKAIQWNNKKVQYYIKFNTFGVEAGHIVNPWSIFADEYTSNMPRVNAYTGKNMHEYKEVSEDVFRLYLRYLETRNNLFYTQAERMATEQYA